MGRLIDYDVLLKDFQNTITAQSDTFDWLNMISRQPTAFDPEKVVAELERNANEKFELYTLSSGMNFRASGMSDAFEEAIDIVRKGGV